MNKQEQKPLRIIPLQYFIPTFRVGAFRELDPVYHFTTQRRALCRGSPVQILPAGWKAPKILRRNGCDFFFFFSSYTSLLSSIFLGRQEHDLSGKVTTDQVRVLSVNMKYFYFAASTVFKVLPKTQLTYLYGAKFYEQTTQLRFFGEFQSYNT